MMAAELFGLEDRILDALKEKQPLSGYEIAKRIGDTDGSMYPALFGLEMRARVHGKWEAGNDGRRRKMFRLGPAPEERVGPIEWVRRKAVAWGLLLP